MLSYDTITKEITSAKLRTAYLLMGEEPYFIEKLTELFRGLVPEDEQDFNLTIHYGSDKQTDVSLITSDAMRFPMMGNKHIIIVKEAQQINDIDRLASLLPELPESSCLILAYKKKADKRKALYKAFSALDAIYESNPLSEREIPHFITKSFEQFAVSIDAHSAQLMAEHTGGNLENIESEVAKLSIILGRGKRVTPELIEEHIGLSREYNNFELLRAINQRDAGKAFKIAYYFASNERNHPIQMTLSILFNYFSNLMAVYYLRQKDERSVAASLGVSPYMAKDYIKGTEYFTASQCFSIIRQIRLADASSKGIDSSLSGGEILKELVSHILNV